MPGRESSSLAFLLNPVRAEWQADGGFMWAVMMWQLRFTRKSEGSLVFYRPPQLPRIRRHGGATLVPTIHFIPSNRCHYQVQYIADNLASLVVVALPACGNQGPKPQPPRATSLAEIAS
ncbi:unnamed protein product, partial [Closterium sp. NIES-54]